MPKARFGEKTWATYSSRLTNFLVYAGFLVRAGQNVIVQDLGAPIADREGLARRGKQRGKVFLVSVSPYAAFEAIQAIGQGTIEVESIRRNALAVQKRFELVSMNNNIVTLNNESIEKYGGALESIWSVAKNESSLIKCIELLNQSPNITTKELAEHISNEFNLTWSEGSKTRNGGILRQWSGWVKEGLETSNIPVPPGRSNTVLQRERR